MSKNSSRLARIEELIKPEGKGHLLLWTEDQETYYKERPSWLGRPVNYRDYIPEGYPTPEQGYSRADLEAMKQDGWDLIIVSYVDYTSKPV